MTSGGPVKVLYVVSGTRSGSTILDTLLGGIEGWFSSGELRFLWERGLLEGRRCGCGRPVASCPVWSAVLEREVDGERLVDLEARDVVRWQHDALRVRHTWRILRERPGTRSGSPSQDAYARTLRHLVRAIGEVTGARVIVDSSKHPSDAALLRLLPDVDARFVHVVRDPRAVAFSWRRRKPDPDGQEEMPRWGVTQTALNWDAVNAAADALARRVGNERFLRIRYEDFAVRPREAVARIAAMMGEPDAVLPFDEERTAVLGPNHTVSGNPNRFRTGRVTLRLDDEWVRDQTPRDRWTAGLLTSPMLIRYRYPLRPQADRPR